MKNLTNPKLKLNKVLVANLNDAQMRTIMGGNLNNNGDFKNKLNEHTELDTLGGGLETTSLQSYLCR